jgi:hypothetical protein
MASNFKISTAARNAMCNALVDLVDGGAGAGSIQVRTGGPPANVADADSGTLLATLPMSDPAFGNSGASNPGEAIANAITSDTNVDNSGDAGHFRIKDSDGNTIMQGTAGEAADTPDLTFDEKTFVATGTAAISSLTVTVPIQ